MTAFTAEVFSKMAFPGVAHLAFPEEVPQQLWERTLVGLRFAPADNRFRTPRATSTAVLPKQLDRFSEVSTFYYSPKSGESWGAQVWNPFRTLVQEFAPTKRRSLALTRT